MRKDYSSKKNEQIYVLKTKFDDIRTCYTDPDLINLFNAIRSGDKNKIALYVKKAYSSGATDKDLWNVLIETVGDEKLLNSILITMNLIAKKNISN